MAWVFEKREGTETVWKYPVNVIGSTQLLLPDGASLLHVNNDPQGSLCVWARLDPTITRKRKIVITVVYTGEAVPEHATFFGTVQQGPLVLHVFVTQLKEHVESNAEG